MAAKLSPDLCPEFAMPKLKMLFGIPDYLDRMSLFKIKICGIRFEPDLFAAVDAGADAIGLNFYSPSVRSVSIEQATDAYERTG